MNQQKSSDKKIALVLGSGAARGLAHIGVLKILEKAGIKIDLIVGTSMGAMIGGAYAAGLSAEKIETVACETNWLKVAQMLFPKRLQINGLLDGHRMQDFMAALFGDRQIEELNIPFACVATDIWTGEEIVLNTGSLVRAIRASISFPFLFTPVEINGRYLVDGGVVNPLAVSVAREMGAEFVIAVNVTPPINRETVKLNSGKLKKLKEKYKWGGSDTSTLLNKLKKLFTENDPGLEIQHTKKIEKPGIRQQMVQIATTMENMILALRLKENPADILIRPAVEEIQFFDFVEPRPIIAAGEQAARRIWNI